MSSEMQNVLVYLTAFFMVFLSFVIFSLCLRVLLWIYMQYYNRQHARRSSDRPNDVSDMTHLPGHRCTMHLGSDRQGNIFTIADESGNNALQHRCSDFFYVEQNAEDAARIRAQLEKDEKDLPTYEEVMAMSLAQAQAGSLATHNASNTSVTAATHVPVPPYSQVSNPAPTSPVVTNVSSTTSAIPIVHNGATVWPKLTCPVTSSGDASTSRAAAAAATTTLTTVTITNSVSNTSV
ncbi:uncharacterized protein [Eurosta solidaginis]|uniref:uncharacterized protein isoform X2 n=1 Tax=Eurosta solidaginis TaxID=178769 RepID=UPI0035309A49